MDQNEYLSFTQGGRRLAECCRDMTGKLTIPDSVDNICCVAFEGWPDLTSIEIPSSLTDVDEGTFAYLNGLTEIIVDEGNPSFYAKDAFLYSKDMTELLRVPGDIESYVIPSHVKKINGAFGGCDYLTSIEIPNSVIEIGDHAFYLCDSLESVKINDGVEIIGSWAFAGCQSLKTVEIPGSVTKIESFAFDGCESLTDIDIPEGVTEIGIYAFNNCSSLSSIKIPESMMEIGENAFADCTGITTIRIPSGVSSIDPGSFNGCTGLKEIIVDEGNPHYCSKDGVLYSKDMTKILCVPRDLETFSIPEGVKSIKGAFADCDDLCWIMIPGSVKEIEEESFSCCSGLTTVVIMPGVKRLCNEAFNLCINLTSIDIPDSVTEIGELAFIINDITTIHFRHKRPVNFSKAIRFLDYPRITLYVPWGSKRLYQRHRFYRKFGKIEVEKG